MPFPSPQIYWPKSAFPSDTNLDVPHPLSTAACDKAIETGIASILISSSPIELLSTS